VAGRVEAQTDGVDGVTPPLVRAAGGVVWRPGAEVLLVHRPKYDDWTLPKGKLRRGEHPIVGACREVEEETAVRPSVAVRLPSVSYTTRVGDRPAPKVVDYWAMTVVADTGFTPGAEIDAIRWLPIDPALTHLSYDHDVSVLSAFAALPSLSAPVVLLRHASAGERNTWTGPDSERPLDRAGMARAKKLATILGCFHPARLVSAAPLRCLQTLAPLADATAVPVDIDEAFDEASSPSAAARRLRELGRGAGCTVVCSQRAVIPEAIAELAAPRGSAPTTVTGAGAYATAKGNGWVLSFDGERLATIDELT
jgi:8-oxo-(d)GTP phosphatase